MRGIGCCTKFCSSLDIIKAIPVLERLEKEADLPQNITFAQSNLMKGYYENKEYNNAVAYAEMVLNNSKLENRIKSDAHVIIARSAIKTDNENKARMAYSEVEKIAAGELKAEALYYNAYFENKDVSFWSFVKEYLLRKELLNQNDFDKIDEKTLDASELILRRDTRESSRIALKHAPGNVRMANIDRAMEQITKKDIFDSAENIIARRKFMELRTLKHIFK